jgi:acyl carrier protein
LEERFGVPAIEAYGMTEASHQMCSNPLPPRVRKFGSVGLPAGPDVAIMNAGGQLLPAGESGEVVIRGANVTRGYEANPAANADAFSDGWFRTGDIGYQDRDGYLFLSGRVKEIINRGGEKISPREVDEVLLDHPAVAEALTFALPDPRLGEEIAAVVVLRPEARATEADLISFAAEKLADFKVPRRILLLNEIPKGPTGKPQRIGLAKRLGLDMATGKIALPHVEPRTQTERKIAAIWQAVLTIDSISTNASFFDIGGDSILAAQIVSRVHREIGQDIPIVLLFQSPTIAAMAAAIDAKSPILNGLSGEDSQHMAKLLAEIETMSEDEAERLLARLPGNAERERGENAEPGPS